MPERSPVSELSDDLLVEIISRVPYKSTCCCKCVSSRWRNLISHPDHRKKLPRSTFAGFFYGIYNQDIIHLCIMVTKAYQGTGALASTPPYRSCPGAREFTLNCCNGLLLCRCWKKTKYTCLKMLDYTVCNPATEKWVSVPATEWSCEVLHTRIGFEPAVSSHFHVFEFASTGIVNVHKRGEGKHIKAVRIYSKTGAWTHRSAWFCPIEVRSCSAGAFFNGAMYLTSSDDMVVAVVDVEGNFRAIPIPKPHNDGSGADVYLSRGQLHLAHYGASELSIWALQDSCSENWTLKHKSSHLQLLGKEYPSSTLRYTVIIHPEENMIFDLRIISYMNRFRSMTKLMSYEMDSRELHFICDLEWVCTTYFQYVPFFSESLADGH